MLLFDAGMEGFQFSPVVRGINQMFFLVQKSKEFSNWKDCRPRAKWQRILTKNFIFEMQY